MNRQVLYRCDPQQRAGLTLIELVVVLTVLVALGGLIVPMLPNFLAKTHFAKCSTTIPELNKLWITSYTGDVQYPNGYDSLIEGSALSTELPGADAGGELSVGTLAATEVNALAAIGVTAVFDHVASANATLDSVPIDGSTGRTLAEGEEVAILNPIGPSVLSLGIDVAKYDVGTQFVVLGIGNNCNAVGPKGLMVEAPTHFGGEQAMNPVDFYQRYCVIFAVNATDGTAEFVCACSIHPDGFDGAEAHIRAYYEDQQDGTEV
ncbi:MAG: hypothetical protein P8L85_11210 [Rubripirellula sp.]|nr:hypothetical protein [Rubripirellula sp.]